tara:strand:+ start:675 stop:860 length:186 start_codon:yes stop_codon:yes gene_type:complete
MITKIYIPDKEIPQDVLWDKRINNCLRMRRRFRGKKSWGYCFWHQTLFRVLAKARQEMKIH